MKLPTKHALIVVLLWAFAPLAWFLMWQDEKYHSWFPKLLWINGIIFGVIFTTQSVIAIPRLNAVYDALNIHVPPYFHPTAIILVLLFLLVQIIVGHFLEKDLAHKKGTEKKRLADHLVAPIIILFAIDGILGLVTGLLTTMTPAALLKYPYFQSRVNSNMPTQIMTPQPSGNPHLILASPQPTATPSPRPLTFSEMNRQFGPCTQLPTFMYHHIEELGQAKVEGHTGLTVSPAYFDEQMNYLVTHGYKTADPQQLVAFFNANTPLPTKSVLISFDDGYEDFYTQAFPILQKYHLKSILFLATGLVGNPGYLTWSEIQTMQNSGMVLISNHTWSHKSMKSSDSEVTKEITTADSQLSDHGLNVPKLFAYPYGTVGGFAQKLLARMGYNLAFTTAPGSTLCKQQALVLPRVRVGNASLRSYGF